MMAKIKYIDFNASNCTKNTNFVIFLILDFLRIINIF